jgi:predicted flap endonuclease-1-like 5' DNA nuclease
MFNDILLLALFGLPCWLLWGLGSLLAFLLGWWLNSLLSGYRKKMVEAEKARDAEHARYINLEKDYKSLQYKLEQSEADTKKVRGLLNKCEADRIGLLAKIERDNNDAGGGDDNKNADGNSGLVTSSSGPDAGDGAKAAVINYGSLFQDDNLQIIEGVGPKIETILKDAGYGTWAAVGAASEEDLRKVLDAQGPKYRIHNPTSWPEQARLAAAGEWDKLVTFQKFLDGGRGDEGDFDTPSKVEKLGLKILGFKNDPNDLKIVEGIGPKIEGLLKDAGINTWSDLAAASVDKIKEILAAAGDRYRLAKPDTWPKQAGLAAEGKFSELQEYQDFLDGGKDPS